MTRKPKAVMIGVLLGLSIAVLTPRAFASERDSDVSDAADLRPSTDVNFKAGYTAPSPDEFTSASARFRIPELRCTEATEGISLGIGSEPVFGKFNYLAVVHTTCRGGPHFLLNAHVQGHRRAAQANASAGDRVRVTVESTASGAIRAIVRNLTRDFVVKQTGTPRHDSDAIDFGAFPLFLYGELVEVPTFKLVSITRAKVNTGSGSVCIGETDTVTNVREDQVTGEVEIAPRPLDGCDFSLMFESH